MASHFPPADAPLELTAFKLAKPDFPHAATANQFFTESDFESYRKLGEYLAGNIVEQAGGDSAPGLDALFTALGKLDQRGPDKKP